MSLDAMAWALTVPVGGNAKVVLLGLANHAHPDGSESYPALDTLSSYAHCDRSTARRNVRRLVADGWAEEDGRGPRGQIKYRLRMDRTATNEWAGRHPEEGWQIATPSGSHDATPEGSQNATPGVALVPQGGGTGASPGVAPTPPEPSLNRPEPVDAAAPRADAHDAAAGGRAAGGQDRNPSEPDTWPAAYRALVAVGFTEEEVKDDRHGIWVALRREATAGSVIDFDRLTAIVKADREIGKCTSPLPRGALAWGLKAVVDRPLGEGRPAPRTSQPAPRPGRDELVIPEPSQDAHEAMARLYSTVEPESTPEALLQLQTLCPLDVTGDGVLEVTATAQAGRVAPERLVPWMQQVAAQLSGLAGVRWVEREEAAERVPLVPA